MTALKQKKDDKKVIDLSLFDRPMASGAAEEDGGTVYDHLTLKNISIGIGALTFLIFLASVVSMQMAVLSAALMGIFGLMLMEVSSRRKWERSLLGQFKKMNEDYERLVREVARGRNDLGALRKKLSDAGGTVVRLYDRPPGEGVEQRMIKYIAGQIAGLSDGHLEELQPADAPADLDPAIFEKHEIIDGVDDAEIGKHLTDDQVLQLVNASVKQDRIDLFLQPIVALPQRKLRFYETLARIRIMPDIYLPATRYIHLAREQDILPLIDNLLLLRGIQAIRNMAAVDYNYAFFFNITSATLHDPKFMGDLVEFIAQNRTLAPQIIFELGQEDLATMSDDILPTFEGLAKLGCRFSMDKVRSISFDYGQMEARHVRFIKLHAELLIHELKAVGGLLRLKRLKADLDRHGIDMIVERIETDRNLVEVLDLDIDYGQGYLFGKPMLYEKA